MNYAPQAGNGAVTRQSGLEWFDIIRLILAIFLPPVAVFTEVGLGLHFWLNIALTLLGGIPGSIHAVWIVLTR